MFTAMTWLGDLSQSIIDFAKLHREWIPALVFAVSFGESMAVIGMLVPGIAVIFAIGALFGIGTPEFFLIWLAASLGASLGDTVSYLLGVWLGPRARHVWPLSKYPAEMDRAEQFFNHWGGASVFIGRFFGPVRATIPLAAGIFQMPHIPFQIANITSAMVWAFVVPLFGDVASRAWLAVWRVIGPSITWFFSLFGF